MNVLTETQLRNIYSVINDIKDEISAQEKRVQARNEELWFDSIKRLAVASIDANAPHNPYNLAKDENAPKVNGICSRNQAIIRAAVSARSLYNQLGRYSVVRNQALPYVEELEAMSRSLLTR